jgi:NAD(P)H-hydrate epimerase
VLGIFPPELIESAAHPNIIEFAEAAKGVPDIRPDAYKHSRGTVEIRAGSVGATGAAKLAARGATAAGAGLVRLIADEDTWPVLAAGETGTMVKKENSSGLFAPEADAHLIGPGWGTGEVRSRTLRELLRRTETTFVLDADAIRLVSEDGMEERLPDGTIVTPHPGEFALFAGCSKTEIDVDPDPVLLRTAERRNAVVILKGHVMRVAAPDGRLAYVDGMEPVLAVGGSGDVLAGLAAGLAARARRAAKDAAAAYDPFPIAVAAAALLIEAGRRTRPERGFCDACEFAAAAGKIAGAAWMRTFQS